MWKTWLHSPHTVGACYQYDTVMLNYLVGRTEWATVAGHFAGRTTALVWDAAYTTNVTFTISIILLVRPYIPVPVRYCMPVFDFDFHSAWMVAVGRFELLFGHVYALDLIMSRLLDRLWLGLVLLLVLCVLVLTHSHFQILSAKNISLLPNVGDNDNWDANIYVISLLRRTDRRAQMETLRVALGLRWTYVDATDAEDEVVPKILNRVKMQRNLSSGTFYWPQDIDDLATQDGPLPPPFGSDLWLGLENETSLDAPSPLVCATQDDVVLPYEPGLPDYRILSAPKIACWHSHLSVIRRVANSDDKHGVSLVLEDDIDMEQDIRQRLASVWSALPRSWDIVFLGE
jgi:GR25 family glycosyltransferase involved in LPS biosynthesis